VKNNARWKPNKERIRQAEDEIEKLKRIIQKEKTKCPTADEWWYEMSPEERQHWARTASKEQLDKLQKQGWGQE
jgi:hypothetical protein